MNIAIPSDTNDFMKVLVFYPYYPPEIAASLYLYQDIVEGLAKEGHIVELFVPSPTRGISEEIKNQYKRKKLEILYDGKLRIHRFSCIQEGRNPILRAMRYFVTNLVYLWKGITTKADVLFTLSTPPTQGLVFGIIKKIKKIPVVFNLQDIFPDSLVNAGLTKKGSLLWKIGRLIENFTYSNSDIIIVIGESFKKNIKDKGVAEEKIVIIPNWVDTKLVHPIPRNENSLIAELEIDPSKFIVLYAGNFGRAQGADIVIKAAERLIDEKQIQFVIFGGGSEFQEGIEYVKQKNLTNVIIKPLLPPERVSEVYSLGDIAIISCKDGFGNSCIPSKTWSIMACETPILASFDLNSELCNLIETVRCGICIKPNDVYKLSLKICELSKSNELVQMQKSGRMYLNTYLNKEYCVNKYISVLCG